MDQIGIDLNVTGSVLSRRELEEHRKKRGECIGCGRKCFQKKLFKMIPITNHGHVLNGRCLSCNPLDVKDNQILPAASRPASRADLERFSRSQRQLASTGGSSRGLGNSSESSRSKSRTSSSMSILGGRSSRNSNEDTGSGMSLLGSRSSQNLNEDLGSSSHRGPNSRFSRRASHDGSLEPPLSRPTNNRPSRRPPPRLRAGGPLRPELRPSRALSVPAGLGSQPSSLPTHQHPLPTRQQPLPTPDSQFHAPTVNGDSRRDNSGSSGVDTFRNSSHSNRSSVEYSSGPLPPHQESSDGPLLTGMEVTTTLQNPDTPPPKEGVGRFLERCNSQGSLMSRTRRQESIESDHKNRRPRRSSLCGIDSSDHSSSMMSRNEFDIGTEDYMPPLEGYTDEFPDGGDPNAVHETLDRIHGLYNQPPDMGSMEPSGNAGNHYFRRPQEAPRYTPQRTYSGTRSEPGNARRHQTLNRGGDAATLGRYPNYASSRTLNSMSSIEEDHRHFNVLSNLYGEDKSSSHSERDNADQRSLGSSSGHSRCSRRSSMSAIDNIGRFESARGNLPQVLAIMRDSPGVAYMQKEGLKELSSVDLCDADHNVLAQHGAMGVIMNSMRSYPTDLALQILGIRAIWNSCGTKNAQIGFADLGAVEVLLSNMDRYPENKEIQECAMATLSNLAAAETNLPVLLERGTVGKVMEAINSHSDNRLVCIKGCSVITNMASHPSLLKKDIMDLGGGGAVVIAMAMHPDDDELQEKGLRAIRNLSSKNDDNIIELANIGSVEAIVSAMQIHRNHAGVQEGGAWALFNLASNNDNKILIGDSGGLDVVVRTMWVHTEQISVLEWCCRALYALTLDEHNAKMVLDVGGISASINSMQAHVDSASIQEMGCGILANLAWDDVSKRRIVDEEALDAVVLSMVIFSEDPKIQVRACHLVLRLAIFDNFRHMRCSNVGDLVKAAEEKFPSNCGELATRILCIFDDCAARIS